MPSPARIYCFSHAGGTAATFHRWRALKREVLETRVITYPSMGERASNRTLPEIAAQVARQIEAQSHGDFAFFGHSLGSLVAYETTRHLRQQARPGPMALFASGHVAPHLPSPGPVLHDLAHDEFWHEMAALEGTRPEVMGDRELHAAIEPRLRRELRLAETYRYVAGHPVDCDIIGLAGEDDWRAPAEQVGQWRMHTLGGFDLHVFPGAHFFLETAVEAVVECVADTLARMK